MNSTANQLPSTSVGGISIDDELNRTSGDGVESSQYESDEELRTAYVHAQNPMGGFVSPKKFNTLANLDGDSMVNEEENAHTTVGQALLKEHLQVVRRLVPIQKKKKEKKKQHIHLGG